MRRLDPTPRLLRIASPAFAGLIVTALLVTAIAIGGLGLAGAAAAPEKSAPAKKVLKPVERTKRALVFKLRGVRAARINRATARLRIKHRARAKRARRHGNRRTRRHRRSVRRRVSIARVRRAAARGTPLRIHKQPRASGGRLVIGLADSSRSPAQKPSNSACAFDPATFTAPGCDVVVSDTAAVLDPEPLWGDVDCETKSRVAHVAGGDGYRTASGTPQPDAFHRRLTVYDGDDYWGERCELGDNDHLEGEGGGRGTFALYREDQRRITFVSVRMGGAVLAADDWQVVLQMKQSQPSDNGGGTPVLALNAYDGEWRLHQSESGGPSSDTDEIWSAAARPDTWTRFAFDIRYSQDPRKGSVSIFVDLNGDGDALDHDEQAGRLETYTLKREVEGDSDDGLASGDSIPSHLRAGLYHDESISCPNGCYVELDNVQVVE